MDLRFDIQSRPDMLLVTATGKITPESAMRLLKHMFDTALAESVNKILLNALAMEGGLSTLERYSLAVELVEHLKQRQFKPKLAVVGHPPTVDGFAVRVGQNRGVVAEFFSSPEDALTWLNKWPS